MNLPPYSKVGRKQKLFSENDNEDDLSQKMTKPSEIVPVKLLFSVGFSTSKKYIHSRKFFHVAEVANDGKRIKADFSDTVHHTTTHCQSKLVATDDGFELFYYHTFLDRFLITL